MMRRVFIHFVVLMSNILNFETLFSNVFTVKLKENYRSYQPILDVSNAVINASTQLFSKELNSFIGEGEKPKFIDAFDDLEQADFVTQRILELREDGADLKHIAVLFRSVLTPISWRCRCSGQIFHLRSLGI